MAETPGRGGPTLLTTANTSQTIYTNATTWTIVRSVIVANETTSTVTASVGLGTTNADAAGKRLITNTSIDPGEAYEFQGFVPLSGSDLVYAICNTNSGATVTVGVVTGP